MAYGTICISSDMEYELVTDKTLTAQGEAADAKAVGEALTKLLKLSGGVMSGDMAFGKNQNRAAFGATGPQLYFESSTGAMVLELGAETVDAVRIERGGTVKSWFDANGTFYGNVTGKATTAGTADNANAVTWGNVSGKPSIYATDSISASGTNYIRFTNGFQICWAPAERASSGASGDTMMYTFAVPFKDTNYRCFGGATGVTEESDMVSKTTTVFKLDMEHRYPTDEDEDDGSYINSTTYNTASYVMAIGQWK